MQPDLTPDQLLARLEPAHTLDDLQASLREIFGCPAAAAAPDNEARELLADLAGDPGAADPD